MPRSTGMLRPPRGRMGRLRRPRAALRRLADARARRTWRRGGGACSSRVDRAPWALYAIVGMALGSRSGRRGARPSRDRTTDAVRGFDDDRGLPATFVWHVRLI